MEFDDLELEQRVWQRVSGGSREPSPPERLIEEEDELAAACRHLAARESGAGRQRLVQLAKQSQEHAAALEGMLLLSGNPRPRRSVRQSHSENRRQLLSAACRCCAALAGRYEALAGQGEFGCVFRRFADETAGSLAALLGMAGERGL